MTEIGSPSPEIILRTRGVGKVFGKFVALNNISAEFPKGAITSIIGPNGAGKSTYFNLLSGAFPPSSGSVEFEGRDVTGLPQHRFAAGLWSGTRHYRAAGHSVRVDRVQARLPPRQHDLQTLARRIGDHPRTVDIGRDRECHLFADGAGGHALALRVQLEELKVAADAIVDQQLDRRGR